MKFNAEWKAGAGVYTHSSFVFDDFANAAYLGLITHHHWSRSILDAGGVHVSHIELLTDVFSALTSKSKFSMKVGLPLVQRVETVHPLIQANSS
jgi:hypothetical protein